MRRCSLAAERRPPSLSGLRSELFSSNVLTSCFFLIAISLYLVVVRRASLKSAEEGSRAASLGAICHFAGREGSEQPPAEAAMKRFLRGALLQQRAAAKMESSCRGRQVNVKTDSRERGASTKPK